MNSKSRAVEWGKSALIVLLTASALFLGWKTSLFNDIFMTIPFFGNVSKFVKGTETVRSGESAAKEAARPLCIVITDESGGHYAVKYDMDAKDTVYERTSSILSEALGSAGAHEQITQQQWQEALLSPGVYFEYLNPVKLSVLDAWLGARMPEYPGALRRICVTFDSGNNRLYYQESDSGLFYAADTASAGGKAQELGVYTANGALFAFETDIYEGKDAPYTLLMPQSEHPVIRVSDAGTKRQRLDTLIAVFGLNAQIKPFDSNGTLVYVGTGENIRVEESGRVTYRRTESAQQSEEQRIPLTEAELIEKARAVIADTLGKYSGSAELYYETIEHNSNGSYSLFFGSYIAGGRIQQSEEGYTAKVVFTDGSITELELFFKEYTPSGDYAALLPEKQALAAAGGEFMLSFSGSDRLSPRWVKHEE